MRAKTIRSLMAALALVMLLGGVAAARTIERIVAVVNREIILLSELHERVRPMMPQLQRIPDKTARAQQLDQLRRQMLKNMVDEKLIFQEARKLKLSISDQDLERAVKDVMRRNNLSRKDLEKALAQEGKTITAYKQTILKPQLLRMRVINVQVRSRVSVSQDEIRALYQKNLRKLGVETKVRARHIFILVPEGASLAKIKERKRYATSLASKAKKGADFAELATKFSQDPVTKLDGGDLKYFGRGTLPSNVESVVFAMKKGEIAGPLRTDRGFHVLLLVDRKESQARPLGDVKRKLRQELYGRKMEKATLAWLAEVRRKAHIDNRL